MAGGASGAPAEPANMGQAQRLPCGRRLFRAPVRMACRRPGSSSLCGHLAGARLPHYIKVLGAHGASPDAPIGRLSGLGGMPPLPCALDL